LLLEIDSDENENFIERPKSKSNSLKDESIDSKTSSKTSKSSSRMGTIRDNIPPVPQNENLDSSIESVGSKDNFVDSLISSIYRFKDLEKASIVELREIEKKLMNQI
jgi:hypothetical protein